MATILMTKEDAERKLSSIGIPRDIDGNYHIISVLQELGLLIIKETKQLKMCNCSAADECPQGKLGSENRCRIWVDIS